MTVNKECREKIKQIMQDNPDLSYEFVRQLLIAQAEVAAGKVEPFKFGWRTFKFIVLNLVIDSI